MERILIRHLSGSKANQTDFFPLQDLNEITFGRDDAATVKYDPDRDDLVSRLHARISPDHSAKTAFNITDLNSRNGTFVNKSRITGTTRIDPGDVIQFGPSGPEFQFDLDPRPENVPRTTRIAATAGGVQATREVPAATAVPMTGVTSFPRAVGRATVERLITENKSESRKYLINGAAALLGILALVAGIFTYQDMGTQKQLDVAKEQLEETKKSVKKADAAVEEMKAVVSPQQVAAAYTASTVTIDSYWELVEARTGNKIYHRYLNKMPAYLKLADGSIEPYLTVNIENGTNKPINGAVQGSGFVVSDDGFIFTNRHVAAPWRSAYESVLPGVLYEWKQGKGVEAGILETREEGGLDNWTPERSPLLEGEGEIEGRHLRLTVTFAKTTLPVPARLVRESDSADVALLKIDVLEPVKPVQLSTDDEVKPGDSVTVLGYPEISPKVGALIRSHDPLNPKGEGRIIPDPTVTSGGIGKIIKGNAELAGGGGQTYISEIGDVYQLTINQTGAGNSGGPVFDERGEVIAIFTYGRGGQITFAVPIKHGRDIMGIPQVIK